MNESQMLQTSQVAQNEAVLRVEGLRTELAVGDLDLPLVDDVSFAVEAGQTLAIVGESGSGKSMTARSVMGLLPSPGIRVTAGRALLRGEDLLAMDAGRRRAIQGAKISYLPQDPISALNPSMTIGRQIAEPLVVHRLASKGEAARRAVRMIERVGLPEPERIARSFPHQLSGGMRQRALIAMSLIAGPDVLIADEPTTALDVTTQQQILDLLEELQAETGLAIVLITHDFGVVASVADHVQVMYGGKTVESAPVDELFARPVHAYTRGLLASVDFERVPHGAELPTVPAAFGGGASPGTGAAAGSAHPGQEA